MAQSFVVSRRPPPSRRPVARARGTQRPAGAVASPDTPTADMGGQQAPARRDPRGRPGGRRPPPRRPAGPPPRGAQPPRRGRARRSGGRRRWYRRPIAWLMLLPAFLLACAGVVLFFYF